MNQHPVPNDPSQKKDCCSNWCGRPRHHCRRKSLDQSPTPRLFQNQHTAAVLRILDVWASWPVALTGSTSTLYLTPALTQSGRESTPSSSSLSSQGSAAVGRVWQHQSVVLARHLAAGPLFMIHEAVASIPMKKWPASRLQNYKNGGMASVKHHQKMSTRFRV